MFIKFCCKTIISRRFIDCFRICKFMISSKDISASQRLKCSLDIFFLLRNLLRNSVVANVEICLMLGSSPSEVLYKKVVLKNLAKFTGKHLCQSLFFNKVPVLRPATSFKKRLWHKCFPVKFTNF